MKKAISGVLGIKVLNQLCAFLVSIGIARFYGEYQLGQFALFTTLAMVFCIVSSLGSNIYVQRELSGESLEDNKYLLAQACLFRAFNTGILIILAGIFNAVTDSFDWGEFAVFFAVLFFFQFLNFAAYLLKSQSKFVVSELLEWGVFRLGIVIGFVGSLIYLNADIIYMSLLVILALTSGFVIYKGQPKLGLESANFTFDLRKVKTIAVGSLPFLVTQISALLLIYTDTLFIAALLGYEQLAYYDVCYKLAAVVLFLNASITSVISTRISQLYKAGELSSVHNLVKKVCVYASLAAIVGFFVAMLLSKFALGLWGEEFIQYNDLFMLLLVGILLQFALSATATYLSMSSKAKLCAKITLLFGTVNLLLNPLLISMYGLIGAATATLSAQVAITLSCAYFYLKQRKAELLIVGK
ncbi:oligosaccharide flippase family protein [Pseudoalteromonas obscura]|uniref:Oligosaccharide flippase family protein n=1 Tax=Pseudoalteromonas obscura TaxID=3048491 RepID=A0ABT7ERI8_9GAMM|nr:oligosaccharide flippase family protein [Pseudoalteromonas sp. P94(2023)]MDK2597590.1 oligosaccharide flippase family protein [Pseudoalteromonas sp. P94(2023)]